MQTSTEHIETQTKLQLHEEKRTKCLVYTRVMGYHRPVESFNIGKKGEHKQRTHFVE
ncbi:anaerobic ribonucleoside-triphosphate reductase [Algoriphagus algorifonticola]|uniref:anaerobic ribonucleoside-triphosphate reductase n=1 Tax=Algoriphagus algorifonticola TaxID=2593007 RepID=UPI0011AADE05|nr:anaerobic ribonucleoside-triphosphate reductase [Algoriphagus algorifonticola]